ncbi:MAG TPA: DUF4239 domain-containing protein [Rhizomicrobium sp.]|jgi:hypothetical protein|nr:DUF4239 domain-containing protein [Rhizomicrobium sp.]
MDFLYGIPAAVLLVLTLAASIVVIAAGQTLVHRRFGKGDLLGHNEVGGIIIAVSGTIYAVILGFLTVVAWEHYQEARNLVVIESDADIDAWHSSVGLPATVRAQVRQDMIAYAKTMIASEWPLMKEGRFDESAPMISMHAIDAVGSFTPADNGQSNAQSAVLQELTAIHDARQQRIAINGAGISWFEWLVLAVGAACIVCFCWLFGVRNLRTHILMTSTVVTMIVSILVLLFELQYPFRSNVGIGPQAWQGALAHLHQMQSGEMKNMRM